MKPEPASGDPLDEKDLLKRLQAAEPAAQDELVRLHSKKLYATASYFLGYRADDVDDVVQETFISALRALPGFEGRSSLYTWLNRICVNHCFNLVRKRKRLVATESEGLELLLNRPARLAQAKVEGQSQDEQRLAFLQKAIPGLGEPCVSLLTWRFEMGLPLAEIRLKMKTPLGTVVSRLARCVAKLRKKALRMEPA